MAIVVRWPVERNDTSAGASAARINGQRAAFEADVAEYMRFPTERALHLARPINPHNAIL